MNLLTTAAATPGTHGGTFIGHDLNGWIVAMICAIVAAFIYEATMAITRAVTLRIPFLVLQIARLQLDKAHRPGLYAMWRSELWEILRNRENGRLKSFFAGLSYAAGLSFYGARASLRAKVEAEAKTSGRVGADAKGQRKADMKSAAKTYLTAVPWVRIALVGAGGAGGTVAMIMVSDNSSYVSRVMSIIAMGSAVGFAGFEFYREKKRAK